MSQKLSSLVPKEPRYRPYLIREIEAPYLNIWPLQTMSFPCSQDGKGRSRELLIDIETREVVGLYAGGQTLTHYIIEPLSPVQKEALEKIINWEQYK